LSEILRKGSRQGQAIVTDRPRRLRRDAWSSARPSAPSPPRRGAVKTTFCSY